MSELAAVGATTGPQRVAAVLMQLDQNVAAEILRAFSDEEAELVTAEILSMERVPNALAESAIEEFYELSRSGRRNTRGGREAAAGLLEATFGSERAGSLLGRVTNTMTGRSFDFLDEADPSHLRRLIENELPQTIALVLTHLRPSNASIVLGELDDAVRADVLQCIATLGPAAPEALMTVAEVLRQRLGAVVAPRENSEPTGGVQPLVDIINRADAATERALIEALESRNPDLAEEVKGKMVSFVDLARLSPRDVQTVLRGIEATTMALALRSATPAITSLIRDNISERQRELVDDETNLLGPVRMSQVEEARAEIVRAMRELADGGAITLKRADDEDDDYV